MSFNKKLLQILALGLLGTFLTACAETQLAVHTVKRLGGDAAPAGGQYKIGKPYEINNVWYYPKVDYDYDETGVASWYGPQFNGKKTANGEVFDMNEISAAHRTLPLPSFVSVTNLDNGRRITVRINDRGPFAQGRIIDMSRRAAQLLGFEKQGTARVRVQILANESRDLAYKMDGSRQLAVADSPIKVNALPKATVQAQTLPPPGGARVSDVSSTSTVVASIGPPPATTAVTNPRLGPRLGIVTATEVSTTKLFIQAGAFSVFENANRVRAILSSIGEVKISSILIDDRDLYRVRLGPIINIADADRILNQVIRAGYPGSRIIVD